MTDLTNIGKTGGLHSFEQVSFQLTKLLLTECTCTIIMAKVREYENFLVICLNLLPIKLDLIAFTSTYW